MLHNISTNLKFDNKISNRQYVGEIEKPTRNNKLTHYLKKTQIDESISIKNKEHPFEITFQ